MGTGRDGEVLLCIESFWLFGEDEDMIVGGKVVKRGRHAVHMTKPPNSETLTFSFTGLLP